MAGNMTSLDCPTIGYAVHITRWEYVHWYAHRHVTYKILLKTNRKHGDNVQSQQTELAAVQRGSENTPGSLLLPGFHPSS